MWLEWGGSIHIEIFVLLDTVEKRPHGRKINREGNNIQTILRELVVKVAQRWNWFRIVSFSKFYYQLG